MRSSARSLLTPVLFLLATTVAFVPIAGAAVVSWNNPSGGSWSTAANWAPAGVPGAADDVRIDLAGSYTITVTGAINIRSLTVGAAGGAQTITGTSTITTGSPSAVTAGSTGATLRTITLAGAGGFTVPAGSAVTLQSCTVASSLVNNGTIVLTGTGSVGGAFTSGAGSTLRLRGSAAVGGATQTFSTGFTNNGLIELTSIDANWAATLLVSSGTLVNAPTRTIDVQAGTGGARTLTARLDNQGEITLGAAAIVNKSAVAHTNSGAIHVSGGDLTLALSGGGCSFTNTGTLDVNAGRTLSAIGGTFTHNAGSLGPGALSFASACTANLSAAIGVSAISLNGATLNLTPSISTSAVALACASSVLNGPGTVTNSAGVTLTLTGSTIAAPLVNDGTVVLTGTGSVTGSYTSHAGSILRVTGNDSGGGTSQTFATGFTNNGTVELTSSGSAWASAFHITSGTLTNPATRTIQVLAGSGGARTLGARLDNQGTVQVTAPFTLAKTAVAHLNSGAFEVTGADVTLSLTGTGGSFTNTGSITLAAGRTLTASAGTFNHSGGSLGPSGTLSFGSGCVANLTAAFTVAAITGSGATIALTPSLATGTTAFSATGCTLNGPGTITNSAGITLPLTSCTVNAALSNEGILVLNGTGSVNGAFTTGAASVLRVQGNTTTGGAVQTFAGGFTNNGIVELTATGSAWASTLNVTSGILLNPAGRTIDVQGATGGARALNARLDNRGLLSLGAALTVAKPGVAHVNSGTISVTGGDLALTLSAAGGSFTNTGAITLSPGRTLSASAGVFSHDAGSLGPVGTLSFATACTANLVAPFSATALAATGSTVNLTGDLSTSGTTLSATGSTFNGPGILTNSAGVTTTLTSCTLNGAIVNEGTLVLSGTGAVTGPFTSGSGSTLRVQGNSAVGGALQTFANGFTNQGAIELTSTGSSWASALQVTSGALVNPVTRTIGALAGAGGARTLGARLVNEGTLDVNAPLTLAKPAVAHVNSGTVNVSTGDLVLTLAGAGGSFTNTGALVLSAGRTITVSSGEFRHESGSLGAAGTLVFNTGAVAHLIAPFTLGALSVSGSVLHLTPPLATSNLSFTASGSTIHGPGTLTHSSGLTLTLPGCTLNLPLVNEGTLVLSGSGAVNGAFTSGPGSTLRILGTDVQGAATQTFASGFINNGTVELTSTGAVASATLGVTSGTLVNPAARLIDILGGTGGARSLLAQLDNAGTLRAGAALTIQKSGAAHLNAGTLHVSGGNLTFLQSGTDPSFRSTGTVDVAAGRTLIVDGGSFISDTTGTLQGGGTINALSASLISNGAIRPGSSPGLLRVTGALAMGASSRTHVELGGTTAGAGFDRLAASGALSLGGSLELSLVNGFAPAAGQSFPILAGGPRTGRFSSISGIALGGGLSLEPQYSDSAVVLRVVAQTWVRQLPLGAAPAAREGHSAVLDPSSRRMIVFGGATVSGVANDVHVLTHADGGGEPEWLALAAEGEPPAARWHHSAAYDPGSNTLIVFGGDDGTGSPTVFGDLWLLSHANGLGGTPQWSPLPVAGGPGARTGAAAAYDAAGKRLLLFGGSANAACGSGTNDVWVLSGADGSTSSTWTALSTAGSPPAARSHARAGYDALHDRLVLFGGQSACSTGSSAMYALTHANGLGGPAAWVTLAPSGAPPEPASLQAVAYEPVSDRLTVFGGTADSTFKGGLSTLLQAGGSSGTPAWTDLPGSSASPAARADASAVQGVDRVVLFGGRTADGPSDEVFTLETDAGRVLDVSPGEAPPSRPGATAFASAPAPNPSSGAVRFAVNVPGAQHVELVVRDLAGRRMAVLQRGALAAGTHSFTWNGSTSAGTSAPAGVYFVQLRAAGVQSSQRVLRVR